MKKNPEEFHTTSVMFKGLPKGRVFQVSISPNDAIQIAIPHFTQQGFRFHPIDVNPILRQEKSDWTVQLLGIGDQKKSSFREMVSEVVPLLDLMPGFRRHIAPTLLIIAAKVRRDQATELVILPQDEGTWTNQDSYKGVIPLLEAAFAGIYAQLTDQGHLIQMEKPLMAYRDKDAPTSRKQIKRLIKLAQQAQ